MKIGIDLDGVVIDSETTFRTYEEIFDIDTLMGLYTIDNLVELTGRFKIFENDTYPENNVEKNSIIDIGIFTV